MKNLKIYPKHRLPTAGSSNSQGPTKTSSRPLLDIASQSVRKSNEKKVNKYMRMKFQRTLVPVKTLVANV